MLSLTNKQKEFWNNCNHRWNIKSGATRSGKTFLDYYLIPKRIRTVSGQPGLYVILGNTKSTLQRNIIEPLQNIWGSQLVSNIKSDNTAALFGEKVYCIGADKISQVDRLRGSSIKYCYGDEVATWHRDVFDMLKSRLDRSYSRFDGTCNPEDPKHWFKQFIDSKTADVFYQKYTLYDNTFLSPEFVRNLENEYRGTVYFDRFILGEWQRAEGIVFRDFANNPNKYIINKEKAPKEYKTIGVGYDLGGNKSNFALVATGITVDNTVVVLRTVEIKPEGLNLADVESTAISFIEGIEKDYNVKPKKNQKQRLLNMVRYCYVDDNYYTTINSLNNWRYIFDSAAHIKARMPLEDRPIMLTRLMAQGRFKVVENECASLVEQLSEAVYDDKSEKAVICDDGSMNIDVIDAFFYSIADDYLYLID